MFSSPPVSLPTPCRNLSLIHATCPAHLILLILITQIVVGEECKSLNSSLCGLFCSLVILSFSPNILFSTLFSNILSPRSSLSVSDLVSHPYKARGKIIILYIIIGWLIGRQNILHHVITSIPWLQSALHFFLNGVLICYSCYQIFELFSPFEGTIINLYILNLSCILISRHENVHSVISISF